MTNHGDDCYFYYYSFCTKGDSCPFRHCEAAMGSETVCSLWQEGGCFRPFCKFRHMKITKNRKEIPCYWENQPAGCQKPHCAFYHEKPRCIEGVFVPPDKSVNKNEEQQCEEQVLQPAAPLPTTANPQLRGIIKTETQEPVPSPTHPPVVINPADDDEDEDDQFSEEGEDGKGGPSPRKLPKSDNCLNFGVSTLEEIRLRKALKASMKRAWYPIQSAETSTSGEKENIQLLSRQALLGSTDGSCAFDEARPRISVVERLGRKIPNDDVRIDKGLPLKRSLAERLGKVIDDDQPLLSNQKGFKSVKERLGLFAPVISTQQAETSDVTVPSAEQIRIKTLEEIKQEKATKSQSSQSQTDAPEIAKAVITKVTRGTRRSITVKDVSVAHVKTFSEILHAKKKKQEEQQEQNPIPKKARATVEKASLKRQGESATCGPGPEVTGVGEVRVKTLEEIRREKAARIQAQQASGAEDKKGLAGEENSAKKPPLLRIKKLAPQSNVTVEKVADGTEKPSNTAAAVPETSNSIKVKTFEEIMKEKRLRKQEMEQQAKAGAAEAEPSHNQVAVGALKRNIPAKVNLTSPDSSSASSTTKVPDSSASSQKVSARKVITHRSKAASGQNSRANPETSAAAVPSVPSVQVRLSASPPQDKTETRSSQNTKQLSPVKQVRAAAWRPSGKPTSADTTLDNQQNKAPENTTNTKVRPKLNVKPSVMKPAAQVKPGQKRRGSERSAVAAVKPLNTTSVLEQPQQDTTCTDTQGSSPQREELQTVPVFKQSPGQGTKLVTTTAGAARETCAVPQSPVLRSPTQPKTRRASTAGSRSTSVSSTTAATSAMDDFEELINEFTDDHLEDDVDPGIQEDDLLKELSEMIDS
ncbi:zinc finger CCCH domain-containing protein 11A isoform 2-T3 [Pholidichthys leucotaenia]